MSDVILIHVDGITRAQFFVKLAKSLKNTQDGYETYFITECSIAEKFIKKSGEQCSNICEQNISDIADDDLCSHLYSSSLCGKLGSLNYKTARRFLAKIKGIIKDINPVTIWCWNGTKFVDRCLSYYAQEGCIKFKAFEVANIPGFFVVEDGGVNAESQTYAYLSTNQNLEIDPSFDYKSWRESYILKKNNNSTIPQASVKKNEMPSKIKELLRFSRITPGYFILQMDRGLGYIFKKMVGNIFAVFNYRKKNSLYIVYFPQQVSSDSQLLFHSTVNNWGALNTLLSNIPEGGVLVSNLHPAEHRLSSIFHFLFICIKNKKLVPATGGAWELLKNADEVITINSTVGLEAAILNRPCKFMGKSFFQYIIEDERKLKWFLSEHINALDLVGETLDKKILNKVI
ncbi:capsular polysaccharide export protein, LipB/KpsS family [Escherichia coli]|uniref:capsular polysaccharide export protein, LipB/KpsS family n=1 Tax=Escherichia coli TaxID=562 RepID=UPI001D37009A|nr:hypothetical protein [Escherichia coli]